MARPSSYKKELFATLKNKEIKCVYVFMDGNTPIYIGKTKNTKKRFQPYSSCKSHNIKLNDWLISKGGLFDVVFYESDNIDILEIELIKKHKRTLFNISHGGDINWIIQSRENKPWIAGRGIMSPISSILRKISDKHKKDKINLWLRSISDEERCVAEIQFFNMTPARNTRWLELTRQKMINYLSDCVNG